MQIIGSAERAQTRERLSARIEGMAGRDAWALLGWIGLMFIIMGAFDIGLGIYPTAFGNPEWEFGVISGILNGFAIPTMGAYLLVGSLVARERTGALRAASVALIVVAAVLVVLGLFYLMVVPIALKAVGQNDVVLLGIKKAILKGAAFLAAYLTLYLLAAVRAWRSSKRP